MSSSRHRMLSSHEVRRPLLCDVVPATGSRDVCNENRRRGLMAIDMERTTSLPECYRKSTSPKRTERGSTRSSPKEIIRSEADLQRQGMPSDWRPHQDGFRLELIRTHSLTVNPRLSPRYRPLVLDPTALEEPLCFSDAVDRDKVGKADGNLDSRGDSCDRFKKPETQRLLRQSQTEELEVADDSDDEIYVRSIYGGSISSDNRRYKALSTSEPLETTQPETVKDDTVNKPETVVTVPAKRCSVPKSLFDRRRNFAKLYRYASGPEIVVHSVNDDDDPTPFVDGFNETGGTGAISGPRVRGRHGASFPRFPFAHSDTAPVGTDDDYGRGRMRAGKGMMSGNFTAAASPSMQSTTSFLRNQISSIFQVGL